MTNINPINWNTTITKKALEKARDEDRERWLKRKEERKNK